MGKTTKAAVSELDAQVVNDTSIADESTLRVLARVWPAAIAARTTREPTTIEIDAADEFQQIKAELRTNFE
jgi:hypothetical protein